MSTANETKVLKVSQDGFIRTLTLNRPHRKNAFNSQLFADVTTQLNDAAKDENTLIVVLTGTGEYYSSGVDIKEAMTAALEGKSSHMVVRLFMKAFIDFPKILVALLNGPAIGVAATTLALCDIVYASDKAFLWTPFSSLGLAPEGGSSYTFARMMGTSRANEMLMLGKRIPAEEGYQRGLVTRVFPDKTFQNDAWAEVNAMTSLSHKSLIISKELTRHFSKEMLQRVIDYENDTLEKQIYPSQDRVDSFSGFANKSKSKL